MADAVLARLHVTVVLFGVEESDLVVGLRPETAPSTVVFRFPMRAVTASSDVFETAQSLGSDLVHNNTLGWDLIGVHSIPRDDGESVMLVSYAAICHGRPPLPRAQGELQFAKVRRLRKKWPEFLRPHDQVLKEALRWLFREIQDYPVVADMCGPRFTIRDLRKVYEQAWGVKLDASNFQKQVTKPGLELVAKLQEFAGEGPGKPAALYGRGSADLLNPPIRPPHGKQDLPSVRVWGRDGHGRLDHGDASSMEE